MSKTKKPLFDSNPNPLISSHSMEIKARCVYHKSLELTNFCKDLNCLMPLCPECMKNHLEKHKIEQNYGDIDRIETVLEEALIVIEKLGNFYRSDLSNIDNLNRLKREAGKIIDDKISLAKKKIYSIIENFFTIFAKESKEIFLKQENCFFEELETSKKFLNYKMEEIEKFRKNLKDSKKFVKYIVKLNSTTFYSDNFNYHKEIEQYLDLLQNKLVQPVVDDSKLYSFNLELAKFIFLKNAEIYKENLDDLFTNPPKPNDNYRIKSSSDKKIMDISPKYKSFKEDLNNVLHSHNKKLTPKSPEKRLMDLSNFLYKGSPGEKQSYYSREKDDFNNYTQLAPIDRSNFDLSNKKKIRFSLNEEIDFPIKINFEKSPKKEPFLSNSSSEIPSFSRYNFNKETNQISSKSILKKSHDNTKELYISVPSYFSETCHYKFLHYFKPQSKKLLLHNLENPGQIQFEEVTLNIQFTIPENHRSLITPNGDIYLSGGSSNEKKGTCLNSLYKFNKYQKTLSMKNPMKGSRKAHGFVCFQDNWLFCGGGLDDRDEALNTCEKYDIENEIWVECSKMVKKGSYFTLITFGEEYIYKFGGVLAQNGVFVEKYDVLNDKWLEINYFVENKSFGIGALCGGVQVNDRDIFVFGGVENHSEVNKSFVFRINEGKKNNAKYYITEVNSYVMPFEGFVDTITIVDKGQVLALVDSLKETSLNSKFILGFNGKKWEKIL